MGGLVDGWLVGWLVVFAACCLFSVFESELLGWFGWILQAKWLIMFNQTVCNKQQQQPIQELPLHFMIDCNFNIDLFFLQRVHLSVRSSVWHHSNRKYYIHRKNIEVKIIDLKLKTCFFILRILMDHFLS